MKTRVYVLIDAVEGKAKEVAQTLSSQAGITLVDCVQ